MILYGVLQMGLILRFLCRVRVACAHFLLREFPATHEGVLTEDMVSSGNLAATSKGVAALNFKQGIALVVKFPATVNKLNRNYPIPIDYSRAREAIYLSGFKFISPDKTF